MICPSCQRENPTEARFCMQCGVRLALACAQCGAELPAAAGFCISCGRSVAPASAPAPERDLRVYTPKHL